MATLGNTPRPAYVYDTETDTWVPIGVGAHTHDTLYVNQNIIDAKGDLIVGTSDNSYDRLAAGNSGDTLVADSSASTGLRWQGSTAAGRNFVINGGMDIWQRGTSFANPALGYTADRWQGSTATAGTVSRVATGDTTNLPNIQYALRYQRTNGSTSTSQLNIIQNFETVNSIPLAGKTITLSFYARKGANYSPTSSLLGVILATGTGTDQNYYTAGYTGSADTISSNATLTTTWQRFTYTATLPTTMTEMAVYFYCAPTGTAGAADYYEITGIQVELGSVATSFSRAQGTLAGELAACQRYYQNLGNAWLVGIYIGGGVNGNYSTELRFPVQMRGTPTATYEDSQAVASRITTYTGAAAVNNVNASVSLGDKGLTWSISGNNGYIIFNPYNLKVSAEL